jgi:predicted KAP-like P-loop ATPase
MGDSIPIVADIPQADPRLGYAEALSDAIRGGTPPQFTIGIYGPWGSGKSSLLNAIHRELTQGEDVLPVFFDAWRYERSEYIVVPLLHAIYSETLKPEDKRVAHYFKQALTSLIYSLNFKLGIVELDLDSKDAVSLVPLDDAFARPFEDLRKVPQALGNRRIVVLIDDLDRCSPENVVAVLESINLVMDIPGFIFVLALDYDVLVRAVSYKYPHVSGHILIEKMVQVPFRVPRLDLDPDTFARELIPDWFGRQARLPRSFSAMQST